MNAIISLCHFCEVHGPAILFCTQPFHSPEPNSDLDSTDLELRDEDDYCMAQSSLLSSLECSSKDFTVSSSVPTSPSFGKSKTTELCEACQSLSNGPLGFVSNDKESLVSYISSQNPRQPGVYGIIRQACVRSLSCEECPGESGPIFFGDDCSFGDDRGSHVLSFKFFLKDFHSRGFKRRYSIIVVMRDKIFLLNSWPFLTEQIQLIVNRLKAKAEVVFMVEHSQHPHPPRKPPVSVTQRSYCPQRFSGKQARSLAEITNDKLIFQQLHTAFTWLLKAGGNRLTERMLEGPPSEDSSIDLDRLEETEEGFVKVYSQANIHTDWSAISTSDDDETDTSKSMAVFTHLRSLLKVLGRLQFIQLAHHVIIGHQIIVRAHQRKLIRSVIDCLKLLLPKGCCHAAYLTKNYTEWKLCNFVGMLLQPLLPTDLGPCIVLDISGIGQTERADSQGLASTSDLTSKELHAEIEELKLRYYLVHHFVEVPAKGPTVLENMEKVLMNDSLEDSVVDLCLTCLKEEWLNKAKALYKYTKVGGNRSKGDEEKLLQIVGAREEDKIVLVFWMTGLQNTRHISSCV